MEVLSGQISGASLGIDLIHDTRHLCTRIRIDIGTNAMSHSIAGGKQAIKFAKSVIAVEFQFVCSLKTSNDFIVIGCCEDTYGR